MQRRGFLKNIAFTVSSAIVAGSKSKELADDLVDKKLKRADILIHGGFETRTTKDGTVIKAKEIFIANKGIQPKIKRV
jgi:hypothetical protein